MELRGMACGALSPFNNCRNLPMICYNSSPRPGQRSRAGCDPCKPNQGPSLSLGCCLLPAAGGTPGGCSSAHAHRDEWAPSHRPRSFTDPWEPLRSTTGLLLPPPPRDLGASRSHAGRGARPRRRSPSCVSPARLRLRPSRCPHRIFSAPDVRAHARREPVRFPASPGFGAGRRGAADAGSRRAWLPRGVSGARRLGRGACWKRPLPSAALRPRPGGRQGGRHLPARGGVAQRRPARGCCGGRGKVLPPFAHPGGGRERSSRGGGSGLGRSRCLRPRCGATAARLPLLRKRPPSPP